MRFFNLFMAGVLALTALPLASTARAEGAGPELARDMAYVPGEAVVAFESGLEPAAYAAQASALADVAGAQVVEQGGKLALLSFAPEADVAAAVDQLSSQAGVVFAEPNYVAYAPDVLGANAVPVMAADYQLTDGEPLTLPASMLRNMRSERSVGDEIQSVPTYPNDFSNNWSWVRVGSDIVWPDASANPVVCVLDTGVDANHPDLQGRVINGRDYVDGDMVPADDNGHGTHVAGTIAARMNNGASTVAGISTAKVLAVKVLNSQGLGTSFDISLGIKYCANNGAKIINLSLGSYSPSQAQYGALYYAEVTKGLLVVAAAGNDSRNTKFFPAAWSSSNTCKNGAPGPCAAGNTNALASGLLSVAAARSLRTKNDEAYIWVDNNGNSTNDGEDWSDCATAFSNYGAWVSIAAPGEDVLSTTPVSYPFYLNYYNEVPSGYAALSGTSMAAAHVSGAAARVWSVGASLFGTTTRQKVKTQLVSKGESLNFAQDPNWSDTTAGYNGGGYNGDAPFCWPNNMSSTRYLSVPAAMMRMRIGAILVLDAGTGLPLAGASVRVNAKGATTAIDTAVVSSRSPFVDLLNVPARVTKVFEVKVIKSGYTTGVIKIGEMTVSPYMAGSTYSGNYLSMAIPRNTGITVVASWFNKQAYVPAFGTGAKRDLDFYMWTPPAAVGSSTRAIIGPKETPWAAPGSQSMLNYVWFGTLLGHPYARSFFDGGSGNPSPLVPSPVGVETINIKATATASAPYLKPYYTGNYTFIVTDRDQGLLYSTTYPIMVRAWVKGKPYKTVKIPAGCSGNAWKPLLINNVTYTLGSTIASCGNFSSSGLWPYR
jgi:subtilisin family serine protease